MPEDIPTYYQDIYSLFTQYETIQMKAHSIDLRSYESVCENAEHIFLSMQPLNPDEPATGPALKIKSKLSIGGHSVPLMPLFLPKWSAGMLDLFQAWIEGGLLEGTPPPSPVPDYPDEIVDRFVGLSQLLTGYDDLSTNPQLARTYLYRIITESATDEQKVESLLSQYASIIEKEPNISVEAVVDSMNESLPLLKDITLLWYTATISSKSSPFPLFGTPDFNQYTHGLVWNAAGAHPMGYATYTGSGNANPGKKSAFAKTSQFAKKSSFGSTTVASNSSKFGYGFGYWHYPVADGENTGTAHNNPLTD